MKLRSRKKLRRGHKEKP
ncbi:Bgt-50554 [Blumeria graminis f. sp. tritici]|uniref:Bgt-50554 n=1 Tax=Blumeria graminis f. sp. tritici TaxID=62690 RepID=A0A9X9MEB7_BLUGR|nr:Bgt-50554 [Blumeria graminis f. sp. tritici]